MDLPEEEKKTVLDCVGLYCPVPIMNTKEAIDKLAPGEILEVIADDLAAEEDFPRWAKRTGHTLLKTWKDGSELHFLIKKERQVE
jgi:tRNA 2-thiouridine synthesizing protein A